MTCHRIEGSPSSNHVMTAGWPAMCLSCFILNSQQPATEFGQMLEQGRTAKRMSTGSRPASHARAPARKSNTSRILSLIHISEPTRLLSISYADFCLHETPEHLVCRLLLAR